MEAWEVLAIAVDGEFVCENCLKPGAEHDSFYDKEGEQDEEMPPLFASDATGDEVCGRCGEKIT